MRTPSWAAVGSVAAAILSSACCWLPLVMIMLGVSAGAAVALFAHYRPLFLSISGVLLVVGFVLNYRRQPATCGEDGRCHAPGSGLRKTNRVMLWIATGLVAAFGLFPTYVGSLLGGADSRAAGTPTGDELSLSITGMTCSGCEAAIEQAISGVPGVVAVRASYEDARAIVTFEKSLPPSRSALAAAVRSAGYELLASAKEESHGPTLAGHWIADVVLADGDTVGLVVDLAQRGARWIGEFDAALYGIEDYPVNVGRVDTAVTLHFGGPEADFTGGLSAGGTTLSGILTFGDQRVPARLAKTGEAQFSETFLALESAADDSSRVIRLADDGAELRTRFNADRGKTRLLMLLSPT